MAAPTFQAAGAFVSSATANITPAWPTHQSGDVALLFVESDSQFTPQLVVDAGFKPVPFGYTRSSNFPSLFHGMLGVYWCRATSSSMANPTVKFDTGHVRACIVTFRGCSATGNPWSKSAGSQSFQNSDVTSVNVPGFTTVDDDCLVVAAVALSRNIAGAFISGWANASLASVTERVDNAIVVGDGSGLAIATGVKATAGAVGATTATLAGAWRHVTFAIALTSVAQAEDKTPYPQNIGDNVSSATVDITVPWPTHASGDLGLLVVEGGGFPHLLTTSQGFTKIGEINNGASGGTSTTSVSVWYKVATSGAEASPVVTFIADHVRAFIITVRGVKTSNPINLGQTDNGGGTQNTTISATGGTTTAANCGVLSFVSGSRDTDTDMNDMFGWATTSLDDFYQLYQATDTVGNGSQVAIISGKKAAAGAIGEITATKAVSDRWAALTVSINGELGSSTPIDALVVGVSAQPIVSRVETPIPQASVTITAQDVALGQVVAVTAVDTLSVSITGQDVSFSEGVAGPVAGGIVFWAEDVFPPEATWTREL